VRAAFYIRNAFVMCNVGFHVFPRILIDFFASFVFCKTRYLLLWQWVCPDEKEERYVIQASVDEVLGTF
jgi:hypothetical protein